MIAEAIISNMAVKVWTSMAVIAIKKVGIRAQQGKNISSIDVLGQAIDGLMQLNTANRLAGELLAYSAT